MMTTFGTPSPSSEPTGQITVSRGRMVLQIGLYSDGGCTRSAFLAGEPVEWPEWGDDFVPRVTFPPEEPADE